MAVLNRDAIKGVQDRTIEEVEVPAWNGSVCFGSLLIDELFSFGEQFSDAGEIEDMPGLHVDLLIAVCCDKSGDALFTGDDREWIRKRDGRTIMELANKALDFLGLSMKGHEDEVKNSESTPTEPTESSSPES